MQLDIGVVLDQPGAGFFEEVLGEVVVDEDGRAGDEDRVEQVGVGVGKQLAERLDGSTGFLVEQVGDFFTDRGCLLVVGDHDGADRISQDVEFSVEDRHHGLGLGLGIGHDPAGR